MRKALPEGLVRRNLSLPGREMAGLDFLRRATEASSDSEVTRQALRHLEQLVEDEKLGIILTARANGREIQFTSARFRDRDQGAKEQLIRRSLMLHEQSEMRLKKLQQAMDVEDISEVVRCALGLYEAIVRAAVNGAQFFARLPSGEEFQIRFGSFAVADPATAASRAPKADPSYEVEPPDLRGSGGDSLATGAQPAYAQTRRR